MISRKEYNEALDVIDAFHKQIKSIREDNGLNSLKKNDIITFDRKNSKYITYGKNYQVIDVYESYRGKLVFYIIDDSGKKKQLRINSIGYSIRIV